MKTVKVTHTSKTHPFASTNPFRVRPAVSCTIDLKGITEVKTGMKLVLPENCHVRVFNQIRKDLFVVGCSLDDDGELIVFASSRNKREIRNNPYPISVFAESNEDIAEVHIIDVEKASVRFVHAVEGGTMLFSEPVETKSDDCPVSLPKL